MANAAPSNQPSFRMSAVILSAFCLGYGLIAGLSLRAAFASPWFVVGFIVALGLGVQLTRIAAWGMAEYPTHHHRYGALLFIFGLQIFSMALVALFGLMLFQPTMATGVFGFMVLGGLLLSATEYRRNSAYA